MSSASPPRPTSTSSSPAESYNKSKEFWALKEATTTSDEVGGAVLTHRTSSRTLISKNSLSNLTASSGSLPSLPKVEVQVITTPTIPESRKSARRDSSKKKAQDRSIDKSGTPSAASETDQSDDDSEDEAPKTPKQSSAEKPTTDCDADNIKVIPAAAVATPVASRSSSESSLLHSRINPTRRESTLSASATPDSVLSRKRGSSTRSPSSSRGSSDSPTRLRKVAIQDRELTNSGGFSNPATSLSDTGSSPSKRPTRTVSSEIHALKHDLERERADRAILEAIVLEHQRLIETLSSKLERQSKLLLSLQQSVEMFSRPQRIGHSPATSLVDPVFDRKAFDTASKEDDDDDNPMAPRKSKSARALSSSVHTKSKSKSSNEGDDDSRAKPSGPLEDFGTASSPSASKAAKRKSKSTKDLVVIIDSASNHTPIKSSSKGTSEASSSSVTSDVPPKKIKDKEKDKEKDNGERSKDEKDDRKDKKDEKRKSSRKSMVVVMDPMGSSSTAHNGYDTPTKGTSASAATSPASSVASTPIIDAKKEKRKSRRVIMSDDDSVESHENHGKSDSVTSGSSIHFNSNPSIIPPYAGSPSSKSDHPTAPRRSRSASERKSSTLRSDRGATDVSGSTSKSSRKKEAVTDVEDFTPLERKKRKVRRTASDPDNPNGESKPAVVDDIVPVKLKKKRRSERPSDRNGGSVEIKSDRSTDHVSSGTTTSSPELSKRIQRNKDANASGSDKDSIDKRSKSSPTRIPGTPARRKAASVSAGSHSTYVASPSPERRQRAERAEGERKDSSASESYEPLSAEAAHESNSHEAKRRANGQQGIFSPGSKTHFRLSSRKLEYEEEQALSPKRREVTSTRHGIALDLQSPKLDSKSTTSDAPPSPSAGESGETPRGTSSSANHNHSPRAPALNIPALTISRGSSPSLTTSNEGGFNLELSFSSIAADPARAQFEQERDTREANVLSPRGRDNISSSSAGAPPLTSRTMAVHFLQTLPCNDIGVPVFLEQVCKFLLAEGTSCVALFEKRVDYARLENLRRKLEQTVSNSGSSLFAGSSGISASNTKLIASNIDRDLKGEDPYVVAGVLKRWFMDQPDTLLMLSKSRHWLDVLEITNTELCIAGLQTLYYSLDLARRRVLRYFIDFLKQFVLSSSGITTLEDVSLRFGPLLLRLPGSSSPHTTARGEAPHSAIPSSLHHTNSSSNLSGSTDETHASSAAKASELASPLTIALSSSPPPLQSSGSAPTFSETKKSSDGGSSTTASAVPTHTRIVSRRGSARLEYELPPTANTESNHLPVLLLKYLITRDSEILKNHDQGIEFSRRPDLQYVVRSAAPAKILMLLIDQNYTEREFCQVIWDTCVYYTKPAVLLSQFIALYDKARGEAKWQSRVRMRILMAIKTWVKHSNFSLGPNKDFRALLQRFATGLMKELKEKEAAAIINGGGSNSAATSPPQLPNLLALGGHTSSTHSTSSNQVLDPESRILHSIMNASMFEIGSDDTWIQWKLQRLGTCEPFKYALYKHEPVVVAGQLALIHCRLLSMIHASELTDNASLDAERSPNYTGVVQHINCVSTWVAYEVLCRSSVAERIRILTFYIDLAEQLLALGDFMGCWAIRGAFDLHPVSRLTQTWERLPRKEASRNKKLASLFEPRMNFVEYRKALDTQLNENSFAVPILAFVPKDIIRLESNEPTFSDPGLVDVDKLRSIYYVLQYLSFANTEAFQKLHPTIKPSQPLWDFFANLPVIQEATLEQLSYNAEPRMSVPQNSRRIHSTSLSNPHRSTAN